MFRGEGLRCKALRHHTFELRAGTFTPTDAAIKPSMGVSVNGSNTLSERRIMSGFKRYLKKGNHVVTERCWPVWLNHKGRRELVITTPRVENNGQRKCSINKVWIR